MMVKKNGLIIIIFSVILLLVLIIYVIMPMTENTSDKQQEMESIAALYQQNCSGCHGPDGHGTVRGVQLINRNLHLEYVKSTILQGSARMPKYNMAEPYLTDLAAYVVQLH